MNGRSRVTLALMAVCVLLSLLSAAWGPAALRPMGADNGVLVRHGEVWRLFASAFLHAGWLHLGMNMYGRGAAYVFVQSGTACHEGRAASRGGACS